jgi:hypothetical protein
MKGYVRSIEKAARQNATFRTVLYTATNRQSANKGLMQSPGTKDIASFGGGKFHAIH